MNILVSTIEGTHFSDCEHGVPLAVDSLLGEELEGEPGLRLYDGALPLPGDGGWRLPSEPDVVPETIFIFDFMLKFP